MGETVAEQWAKGIVATWPVLRGSDTDKIKAVAAGECGVSLTNTYTGSPAALGRPERSESSQGGFIWPNQSTSGAHVNISGGGVAKNAPNKANAIAFLEYLSSPSAQNYFANGNNEFPTAKGTTLNNAALSSLGTFKQEQVPISNIAKNTVVAQRILDRVGYK